MNNNKYYFCLSFLFFSLLLVGIFSFHASAYTITTTTSGSSTGTVEYGTFGMWGRGNMLYVSVGGVVPGSYATLAAALAVAVTNDTVFVYNGTYYCNDVGTAAQNITLIGEDKNTTILKRSVLAGGFDSVLEIIGRNTNITGFTIDNSLAYTDYGIEVVGGSFGSTISNCIINNMTSAGIVVYATNNITITGNTIRNCNYSCIQLTPSNYNINIIDNTIIGQNITGKYIIGISINSSTNCVIANNHISTFYGFGNSYGIILRTSVSNCKIYSNQIMDTYSGISLQSSGTGNTISNNVFRSNRNGLHALSTSTILVYSNLFFDNVYGINLDVGCPFSEFVGNYFSGQSQDGMAIANAQFEIISNNNFTNSGNNGLGIYGLSSTNNDVSQNNFMNNLNDNVDLYDNSWTTLFSQNYFDDDPGTGSYPIYSNFLSHHNHITAYDNITSLVPYEYVTLNITDTTGLGTGSIQVSDGPYTSGDWVILWANASFNSYFSQWGNNASGDIWAIAFLMDGNKTVSAEFNLYDFGYWAIFWANATGGPRSYFFKWNQTLSGSASPEFLYIDSDKTVDAQFEYAGIILVTVRYENETEGENHVVNLGEPGTGVHRFFIHYGNMTDTVTFDNLAGTGCIDTSTIEGVFSNNASGVILVNLSLYNLYDPLYLEFRWNDTFGQLYYCTRQQVYITGQENYTFYIRTDCAVYAETTLYLNGSIAKYKLAFSDETGVFIYPNHPYIEVFAYNSSGVYQVIHSEYMDASSRIYPWLVYGEKYFLGAYSDVLDIERIGHIYASSTFDQSDIRIPYQQVITYNIYDLITITYSWYIDGFWVHYVDTSQSTILTEFSVYYFGNNTLIPASVQTTMYQHNKYYYFDTAHGCQLNRSYLFQINTTLSDYANQYYAGDYSTGKVPIYYSALSISNVSIDNILTTIFGGSPVYDADDPNVFVPWTYLLLAITSFILLATFGKLNAFMGGISVGAFLLLAGVGITGISTLYTNYSWWEGASVSVVGVFIIAVSVIALLGGVEK